MIVDQVNVFVSRQEKDFLKSTIPNKNISNESKKIMLEQFSDINRALIQEDPGFLKKVRNFLDITLFEF